MGFVCESIWYGLHQLHGKKETTECKVIEHTSSKRQQPSLSPKVLELDKIIEPLWNIKPL